MRCFQSHRIQIPTCIPLHLGNNHRTPSAWLTPNTNRVTYRISSTSAREVWGTSNASLPTRRWCHVTFSVGQDRLMRFYIDGVLDTAVGRCKLLCG